MYWSGVAFPIGVLHLLSVVFVTATNATSLLLRPLCSSVINPYAHTSLNEHHWMNSA